MRQSRSSMSLMSEEKEVENDKKILPPDSVVMHSLFMCASVPG